MPATAARPTVYQEMRVIAGRQLSPEAPGHTLTPITFVHEASLRPAGLSFGRFTSWRAAAATPSDPAAGGALWLERAWGPG
jgi:hypothetical protein